MTDDDRRPSWGEALGLLALTLLLIGIAAWRSEPLKEDSTIYIQVARAFSVGQLTAVHTTDYPPLYSLLIALARPLTGDWLLAAQLVAVLGTALGVVPLYFLACWAAGRRAAVVGCALYAVHPLVVEWGATAMSDGPYLSLWLTALTLGLHAARRACPVSGAWCGIASGAAYLQRPEGLEAAALAVGFCVVAALVDGKRLRRLGAAALTLLLLAAVATPYVYLLSSKAGFVVLSKKKKLFQFPRLKWDDPRRLAPVAALPVDLEGPPTPSSADPETFRRQERYYNHLVRQRWLEAEAWCLEYARQARAHTPGLVPPPGAREPIPGNDRQFILFDEVTDPPPGELDRTPVVAELAEKGHPAIFTLVLIGAVLALLAWRRAAGAGRPDGWWPRLRSAPRRYWGTRPGAAGLALAAAGLLHLFVVLVNWWRNGYLSERHLLPLVALSLPLAALLLLRMRDEIGARLPVAAWLPLVVVMLVMGADSLRARGHDKAFMKVMAEHVRARDPHGLGIDGIVGMQQRIAHHAGARFDRFDPWRGYREILRQLIGAQARYVIVDPGELYRVNPLVRLGWLRPVTIADLGLRPGRERYFLFEATFYHPVAD